MQCHKLLKSITYMGLIFFVVFESHIFAQNLSSVPFETIDQGQYSDITTAMNLVIYKKKPWIAFWKKHAGNTEPPSVNFRNEMVVAIMLGARPDSCYKIDIDSIVKDSLGHGQFDVSYKETVPGNGCACLTVITTPYHIVKTEKSHIIRFRGDITILDCE